MKKAITWLAVLPIAFLLLCSPAQADQLPDKKVVIVIHDFVDISDLEQARTPNLHALIAQGGTGLMNVRSRSGLPASAYMSLAVGSRAGTVVGAELSFNCWEPVRGWSIYPADNPEAPLAGELYASFTGQAPPEQGIVNPFIEPIKNYASTFNPPYFPAQLGERARQAGLRVAVLGNADTREALDRSAVLLAMDANGQVAHGNVSQTLLEEDPSFPGGLRTRSEVFIDQFSSLYCDNDILVVDLGDTTRVEKSRENCSPEMLKIHKQKALERNDYLVGEMLHQIDLQQTMLFLLTPNPSGEMVKQGNFGLAPILVYQPGIPAGLLSSSTTRRAGLVSNSDFLPAVMAFLGDKPKPVMKTTPGTDHSLQALDQKLAFLIRLRQQRGVLHLIFIFFAVLTIAGGYWVHICKQEKGSRVLSLLLLTTLSMPLVILCLSLFGYRSIGLSACLLIGLSILAGVTLYYVFGSNLLPAVLWLSFATMLAITADAFLGSPLMINSALGSDSIAGGRFYGIGNDYMGILLASSIVSITLLISSLRMKPLTKALLGLVPLGIVTTAIGHPHYGANMGGLITGIVMLGFFYLVIMEIRLTPKRLVLIGLTALAGVLAVARLDALFSANPSHAGQAITSLFSGGWTALFSIIKIKLGILGNAVYHSPWSLVLLLSVIFLASSWIRHQQTLGDVLRQFPAVQKAGNLLLLTAVTVFLVNDTGVIAAALIFLYLCSLLWAALAQNRLKKESGGDRL